MKTNSITIKYDIYISKLHSYITIKLKVDIVHCLKLKVSTVECGTMLIT